MAQEKEVHSVQPSSFASYTCYHRPELSLVGFPPLYTSYLVTLATGQVSEIPGRETLTYIIIVGVNR